MSKFLKKHRYLFAALSFTLIILAVSYGVSSVDASVNNMIVEYASNLGWNINPSPVSISHLVIPNQFDAVFETYNTVQKQSGFDISHFKGKRVCRYTYEVENHVHSKDSKVYLGILVFENRIIAGEISSTDINGFMHSITSVQNAVAK